MRAFLQDLVHRLDLVTWDARGREIARVELSPTEAFVMAQSLLSSVRRSIDLTAKKVGT